MLTGPTSALLKQGHPPLACADLAGNDLCMRIRCITACSTRATPGPSWALSASPWEAQEGQEEEGQQQGVRGEGLWAEEEAGAGEGQREAAEGEGWWWLGPSGPSRPTLDPLGLAMPLQLLILVSRKAWQAQLQGDQGQGRGTSRSTSSMRSTCRRRGQGQALISMGRGRVMTRMWTWIGGCTHFWSWTPVSQLPP